MKAIFLCLAKIFDSFWIFIENENIKCFMKTNNNSLSDDNITNVWTFLLRQEVLKKTEGQAPTALCPRLSEKSCHSQACSVLSVFSPLLWLRCLMVTGRYRQVRQSQVRLCTPLLQGWLCTMWISSREAQNLLPIAVPASPPWDCKDDTEINVLTHLSAMTLENRVICLSLWCWKILLVSGTVELSHQLLPGGGEDPRPLLLNTFLSSRIQWSKMVLNQWNINPICSGKVSYLADYTLRWILF